MHTAVVVLAGALNLQLESVAGLSRAAATTPLRGAHCKPMRGCRPRQHRAHATVAGVARSNQAMERLDDDGRAITHMRLGIVSRLFLWWQRRWD